MNGQSFARIVCEAFEPFLKSLGFVLNPLAISGRLYLAEFASATHVLSVSYEPGDRSLAVILLGAKDGTRTDIDDRTLSPRLSDLNARYMNAITDAERSSNEKYFAALVAADSQERELLKAARELRLVLPPHLRSLERSR
jgi:hypothetical protein